MGATAAGLLQLLLLVALLAVTSPLLAGWLHAVATSRRHLAVERVVYRLGGIDPDREQGWRQYLLAVLGFSLAGVLLLYLLLRVQGVLPLSLGRPGFEPSGAFNTAISFVTNTNWQWYSGDSAMGHLAQMAGLTVQNFVSAATGIAVAFALVRGLARAESTRLGSFWVDLVRITGRVLLPLSLLVAVLLVLGGVIQNLDGPRAVETLTGGTQSVPGGPVASQEAIKQLGTNGGGFFNANSAHPFENPDAGTNLLATWAMLVIPFAMPLVFGRMVGQRRQGFAVLAVMALLWLLSVLAVVAAEVTGRGAAPELAGAAMEGKEVRLGVWASAVFAASTTGTSTGAVNAMHDSYTAAGGGVALLNMMLGEVSPGGVGSGLYSMLLIAVLTVFLSGLMVGRTPEYLGKKIGGGEITLVALVLLVMPATLLAGAALSVSLPTGRESLAGEGPHALTQMLYAWASASNNNGSAFASLSAGTPFLAVGQGLAMLVGRFVPMLLVLALAGRLAAQRTVPAGSGTIPTHGPVFVSLMAFVVVVVAGLTFFPSLALGPIAEALQ
ncbi:potassium-transporting ATPase subunit KdpA [Auraticoccus sp. F435]|uniref:Potassium-transporting ATPase potassium-binding subunit n=1 Tax=Auraticoccus cholistanensis TaxID=2656650 RepID=A0A6A9UZW6_9ACTN|nr:potassium-transporting ATPase subunit KdpA [Auraticoccus cholistanensis]MVA74549.1 potassium-transporting ATPase subunit KdpA [Auraticoccus cholistanensis]